MATEQQIQKQIITYLESLGAYVVKVITANRTGVADVHCCLNGRWVSIECKRPGESPDPLQMHHLQMVQKAGGLSTWVTSVDQVKDFLSQHNLIQSKDEI